MTLLSCEGSGPGNVTAWTAEAVNTDFVDVLGTTPQVLAVAALEPRTVVLLVARLDGLVAVRARRQGAT
jgi:hypothetical protein